MRKFVPWVLLSSMLWGGPLLSAQEPADPPFEDLRAVFAEQFGTPTNQTIIPVQSFVGFDSSQVFASTDTGYHTGVPGSAKLWAPLEVPAGITVEEVCIEGRDFDAAAELLIELVGVEVGTQVPGFVPPVRRVLATYQTGLAEMPGYAQFCVVPQGGFSFPFQVRTVADVDGANGQHTAQYFVVVTLPATANVQAGPGVVKWHRTIPPAPGIAYFTDVPVPNDYFRYIEAAHDAGIMLGCDPANFLFCPDLPVTRAQLALYLARALGIYWPN